MFFNQSHRLCRETAQSPGGFKLVSQSHVRFLANYGHVFTKNVIAANGYAAADFATRGHHSDVFIFRTQLDWKD